MATIDDFGGSNDPLSGPKLGGSGGWAEAVRDSIREIQGRPLMALEKGTVGTGDADFTLTENGIGGYELDMTLPALGDSTVGVDALVPGAGGWFDARSFGATGDGTTDDTAALQECFDAAKAAKGSVLIPGGVYRVDGTLTMDDCDYMVVHFGTQAWLKPVAGWALTLDHTHAATVVNARVRFESGTPAGAIRLTEATRTSLIDPLFWLFTNSAGTPVGISVEDDSYWAEIVRPKSRRDDDFANRISVGIRFDDQSNAGRVLNGNLADCAIGVEIVNANSVNVVGTAFEGCVTGVQIDDHSNNSQPLVAHCRFEAVTTSVVQLNTHPEARAMCLQDNFYQSGAILTNPNRMPVNVKDNGHIAVVDSSYGPPPNGLIEVTPEDGVALRVNGRFSHPTETPTFEVSNLGRIGLGPIGAGAIDSWIYSVIGGIKFETTKMCFFSGDPVNRPTVNGSRGGNAALASLLTALASLGLITDSTSV